MNFEKLLLRITTMMQLMEQLNENKISIHGDRFRKTKENSKWKICL